MTLDDLKNYWRDVSLKHKDVKQFNVGSWYDAATNTSDKYPLCFWELPYNIQYPDWDKPKDTVQVSFSVFLYTKQDDIEDSHQAISFAKSIGDAIISKVEDDDSKKFTVEAVNAVTVREYSDDYVAGIRYDLTMTVIRDICEDDLSEYFND